MGHRGHCSRAGARRARWRFTSQGHLPQTFCALTIGAGAVTVMLLSSTATTTNTGMLELSFTPTVAGMHYLYRVGQRCHAVGCACCAWLAVSSRASGTLQSTQELLQDRTIDIGKLLDTRHGHPLIWGMAVATGGADDDDREI